MAYECEPAAQASSTLRDQLPEALTALGKGKILPDLQGVEQNLSGQSFPRRTDGQGAIPWPDELGELPGLASTVNNQRMEIALTPTPLAPGAVGVEQGLVTRTRPS